jgi:hypothetical protein
MNFETLTLDEIETIENLTGTSIDRLGEDSTPKGKNLKAIIYVMKKREDPSFTIEQAGKYSFTDALALFDGDSKKE